MAHLLVELARARADMAYAAAQAERAQRELVAAQTAAIEQQNRLLAEVLRKLDEKPPHKQEAAG